MFGSAAALFLTARPLDFTWFTRIMPGSMLLGSIPEEATHADCKEKREKERGEPETQCSWALSGAARIEHVRGVINKLNSANAQTLKRANAQTLKGSKAQKIIGKAISGDRPQTSASQNDAASQNIFLIRAKLRVSCVSGRYQ